MRLTTHSLLLLSTLSVHSSVNAHSVGDIEQQQQPLVLHNDNDPVPPYRTPLLSLHRALVDIPSTSGAEGPVAHTLHKLLTSLNFTATLQEVPPAPDAPSTTPPRYNVLAWSGRNPAPPSSSNLVLLTSHIDTVPPHIPYALNHTPIPPSQPLNYTTLPRTTLLSGRGTVDAKASVAAQITAASLLSEHETSNLLLLYVVSEENSGAGMTHFSSSDHNTPGKFKAAIFGEPTENRLACGHKGVVGALISASGRAGHSGYPWLGKSATAVLVRALGRLLDADLGGSERYGATTVNVGVMEGGVAANVIAKSATARVAVRVAVGDQATGGEIVAEGIRRAVVEEGGEDAGDLEVEVLGEAIGPVECDCDVEGEYSFDGEGVVVLKLMIW